ncbi:Nramp family divalent metal transporter [Noviherbaspirillum sp. Root189]|uniref:Nramp family divalent metal transporter n=1 Tax=Noviherbaspirillum sp. Root189 TaxID=1736487 RepID=UPI0007100601|nr:Nramp family divalent metal transporter [Noviherbaspirillum sp. Root189]KRB79202.1 manganese transporter [Noviherbaspirillum sp. Root189]
MPPPTIVETPSPWGAPTTAADGSNGSSMLRSVAVTHNGHWIRRLLGFMGPGYLVAVGYMDPGNWATDLAGGSSFGYSLLWIIMLSNLMAILLQILSARLGIATGMDLAQACRQHYSRRSAFFQWIVCEIAICATDLAEVIGTAIALNLLFGIPLTWGVSLTVLDVLVVLWLQQRGFRYFEALIISLLAVIFVCIGANLILSSPQWSEVAAGLIPSSQTVTDPKMLYLAIGIIGATVMPHNLYLHSSTVQTRRFELSDEGRRNAMKYASIDVVIALFFALLVNASILVTSAAVFHTSGHHEVAEIQDAYHLLTPLLGTTVASFLFGLALLASGQSSTLTATLAGQVVMEGYVQLKMRPWLRRLVTRSVAIVPALIATVYYGESGTAKLLILSQVILSLQLPFAVVPLVRFTSDKAKMGVFANPAWLKRLAWLVVVIIVSLNAAMLYGLVSG